MSKQQINIPPEFLLILAGILILALIHCLPEWPLWGWGCIALGIGLPILTSSGGSRDPRVTILGFAFVAGAVVLFAVAVFRILGQLS